MEEEYSLKNIISIFRQTYNIWSIEQKKLKYFTNCFLDSITTKDKYLKLI